VRPWATVLRVPTPVGDVWFKANMAALAHEGRALRILAARRPDAVVELLALDEERGWMLEADAGESLRERGPDSRAWADVLALYGQFQLDLASGARELVRVGVPDRRLETLPSQLEQLVEGCADLSPDERRGLLDLPVAGWCEELAALGLPETIEHGDLHDGNVFVRDGRYLLLDWGDACVSHPFFTLSITLRAGRDGMGDAGRVLDAYLEPFTALAPRRELVAAVPLARRVGDICGALKWRLIVPNLPPPHDAEHADIVPERLRMLLG